MNNALPTYALTLDESQLKVINDALIELPVRVAMPVINEINQQLIAARQAEADALNAQRNRNRDETNALPPLD